VLVLYIAAFLLGLVALSVTEASILQGYIMGGIVLAAGAYGLWRMECPPSGLPRRQRSLPPNNLYVWGKIWVAAPRAATQIFLEHRELFQLRRSLVLIGLDLPIEELLEFWKSSSIACFRLGWWRAAAG
jgi:hypothetical protein